MDRIDRKDPRSAARLVAAQGTDIQRIEAVLGRARVHVGRMQPSPIAAHLERVLESFRRTVDAWTETPPSADEVQALREHLEQTLQLAKTSSPTVKVRRKA